MPEYLAPGVYVEETSFRSKSIEGVSTSTCAFVGPTRKGPVNRIPELITSFGEYSRMYGGYDDLKYSDPMVNYMAHSAYAFFDNGGRRLYVARTYVPKEEAGIAKPGIASEPIDNGTATVTARFPGSGYNGFIKVYLQSNRVMGAVPLDNARQGALLRVTSSEIGEIAKPAVIDGSKAPPFELADNSELKLNVSGGTTSTIVFTEKKPARVEGTAIADVEADIAVPADTKVTIKIGKDGSSFDKEITLPAGAHSAQDLALFLNTEVDFAKVGIDVDKVYIQTDNRGETAEIALTGLALLNITATASPVNGTGNVNDLALVTVEEVNSALVADGIAVRATLPDATDKLRLSTVETGAGVSLTIEASSALVALCLSEKTESGIDGATYSYYE
jgi:hypothetical protein